MTSFNTAATSDPTDAAPAAPATTPAAAPPASAIVYNGKTLTPDEVLNKLAHADQFIDQLKAERQADRDLLAQATTALQQAVSAKELLTQPAPTTPPATAAAAPVDVGAAIDQALTQRDKRQAEDANWKEAQTLMTQAFGDAADTKAKEVAASVGFSFDELVVMAKTKPAAFKRLFPELSAGKPNAAAPASRAGVVVNPAATTTASPAPAKFWGGTHRDSVAAYMERLKQLS